MSELQETTESDTNEEQVNNSNNDAASFPSLNELSHQISLLNQSDYSNLDSTLEDESEPAADLLDETIVYEDISTDLNDIKEDFIKLNDEQRNFVMHIYYLYKNKNRNNFEELSEDNPKIILQGPAGTGKSTVINFIEKIITWEENKTSKYPEKVKVLKCAFTGKAAVNIEGSTLHGSFSIAFKLTDLSENSLASKKYLLGDCKFFVCDEISMVGENMMRKVNTRLQEIFENNKLYGNRFVLLAGDLYQIDPVLDRRMYPFSEYWKCCEFYELTRIMRQQNDTEFVTALNNFRECQLTEEDILLLKERVIRDEDIAQIPVSVTHLFFLKKHVKVFNDEKIRNSNENGVIISVFNNETKRISNLHVKIGLRYMITNNIDVGDGLANGTTGVVKHFDKNNNDVSAIWMDFHSNKIGRNARMNYLNNPDRPGFENWVPIQRSVKFRNKFTLIAAEAITVHKSQGQTYVDGVCVHFTTDSYDRLRTDRSLQYVAFTRVQRREDLYIMGKVDFSVMKSEKLKRANNELNRLREEKKLKLAFETFDNKTEDVIVYLNTGSTFYQHHQFIEADKWYRNASLLIFSKTNTIASDQIIIPNFEVAFRNDDLTTSRSGGGIICYKKTNKSMVIVDTIQTDNNRTCFTLFLYENIYILTGVIENVSDHYFKSAIESFVAKYIRDKKCIFFIGNFNTTSSLTDFLKYLSFQKKLSCDILSTHEEIQRDVVFTRNFDIPQNHFGFYQYIPSSHRAIFVKLHPVKSGDS